jgi:hypothetical protein
MPPFLRLTRHGRRFAGGLARGLRLQRRNLYFGQRLMTTCMARQIVFIRKGCIIGQIDQIFRRIDVEPTCIIEFLKNLAIQQCLLGQSMMLFITRICHAGSPDSGRTSGGVSPRAHPLLAASTS